MTRPALESALACLRRSAETAPTDRQLLDQFVTHRDEAVFAALVRRHGGRVLAACRRVLADPADIDDAFQATFLVLLHKAGSVRWHPCLGGWLAAVAHRMAVRTQDAARRRKRHEESASASEQMTAPDPSWREAVGILHQELDRLPDQFRLPLVLCYLEGKSRDEAAAQLGWSVGSVRGRLERGRLRLRRRLQRRGIDLSAGLLAAVAADASAAVPAGLTRAAVAAAVNGPTKAVATLARGAAVLSYSRLAVVALTVGLAAAGAGIRLFVPLGEGPIQPRPAVANATPQAPEHPPELATVTGRVLGPDGKPVAGATVYSLHLPAKEPKSDENLEWRARGKTGADGRFQFAVPKDQVGVSPGGDPWPVLAATDGFGLGWAATSATAEVAVRLVKEQPITGRVIDTQGRPVANARLRVRMLSTGSDDRLDAFLRVWSAGWRGARVETGTHTQPPAQAVRVTEPDRDGRFRITGAGVEQLVEVEATGPTIARTVFLVVGRAGFDARPFNQSANNPPFGREIPGYPPLLVGPKFDLVAEPAKTITGAVHDPAGRPVAGASVRTTISWQNWADATTDRDGRFALTGLRKQAKYQLTVSPGKDSPLLGRSADVPDTDGFTPARSDVRLEPDRRIVVTGRIIDKQTGKGVKSGVRFAPLPDNRFVGKTGYGEYQHVMSGSEADGRFRLTVIPGPGVFLVQAWGGESLDGQHVIPYMLAAFDDEGRKHVKVAADGGFVGAGNAYETLTSEHAVKWLNLAEGAGPVTLDLYVDRGRTGKLMIQDADGQPLAGAIVAGITLYYPYTIALKSAECPVYALEPKKPRTLVIYHAGRKLGGYITMRGEESGPVVAKLQPPGTVTGRILDTDGQPVAGAEVNLSFSADSASWLESYFRQQRPAIRTHAAGRFRIDGIVAGQQFSLSPRKDRTFLVPQPRTTREVTSGAVLDLGDVRTKARNIGP